MQRGTLRDCQTTCSRPQRIAWVIAAFGGRRSICPVGWKMNASSAPPMMAVSIARSHFTHELITRSNEFVLAWPGEDLAEATVICGTQCGRVVDKFAAAGITAAAGEFVQTPLVAECLANMECRLTGTLDTGDHTIFAGEVLAVWISETPRQLLCSVDDVHGCETLVQRGGYRLGVVRR